MSQSNDERQRESLDINCNNEQISPLSNRFLVAHSSPVHDSTISTTDVITRLPDDSFQSSSSNSKSSSSTHSHTSRLQYLMMQHHSAVNSPLAYSRCTSLGSLSSFDIRSSYHDSYTSECSSIKPSGLISPSDMPDSPPCEPEILEEDEHQQYHHQQQQPHSKPNNRTLTMNTTSNLSRTTMMGETVIEKTFIFHQQDLILNQNKSKNSQNQDDHDEDEDEHLDEVIVYTYDTSDINKSSYNNELVFDDDSYRVFNSQIDDKDCCIDENNAQNETSFNVPSHENLSVITEESSFVEELNPIDENNSIKILYDLIKKPHWTNRTNSNENKSNQKSNYIEDNTNTSFSSNPSSLSLDSDHHNQTDDDDEYDQEKGRQLIQRLIEETLARRSLRTDFLHSTSCVNCPSNTPINTETRSVSSSSSSSTSNSTKSCTCLTNRPSNVIQQPQRSQSSPARPSLTLPDDRKRQTVKQKENIVHQTRTSFLRLRQAQQNKRLNQSDKRF